MYSVCFLGFSSDNGTNSWYIDSGATSHMTGDRGFFCSFNNCNDKVLLADGRAINAEGKGNGLITLINGKKINVCDVLYVPGLKGNLLSVKRLIERGFTVIFTRNKCDIKMNNSTIVTTYLRDSLFKLDCCLVSSSSCDCSRNCIQLWHRRMGHRDIRVIRNLSKNVKGMEICNCKYSTSCSCCIESKMTNQPYPKITEHRTSSILNLVHTDICGPFRNVTPSGKKYFMTLIDDYSRYTATYLLNSKDEACQKIKEYVSLVKNRFKKNIIRSDSGGEYLSNNLKNFFMEEGIEHQLSVPNCPQQNGVAERKNKYLVEMVRCMLSQAGLPEKYWGEAVITATYIQNRCPTRANIESKTPYELWNGYAPNVSHMRTFGCAAYYYIPKQKRTKLENSSTKGIFVGYSQQSKGYRILLEDNICSSLR